MKSFFKHYWPGLIIVLIFLILSIATLSDYGMNEDSPFHFLRGQAYLRLLTSGQTTYDQPRLSSPVLFVPGQRISLYKLNAWESTSAPVIPIIAKPAQMLPNQSFYRHQSWNADYFLQTDLGHPPTSDILSAATNKIFYETLGWLGDIEAYHLYILLCAGLAIFAVYYFVSTLYDPLSGAIATITLATFPLFFAESHYNIKDIPQLAFFTISIISCFFWIISRRFRWFTILILSTSLALGTKFNIVFAPFIILPWLITIRKTWEFKSWFSKSLLAYIPIFILATLLIFVLFWPFLWNSGFLKIQDIISFYSQSGSINLQVKIPQPFNFFGFNFLAPILVLSQTPPLMIIGLLAGFCLFLSKRIHSNHAAHILLIAWLLIPVLRVFRPGVDILGSTRHFLEYLPPLIIISSLGLTYLIRRLPKVLSISSCVLYFGYILYILVIYHPFQNIYFNSLVGGPSGAQKLRLFDWPTYYDTPYRQAVNWLNSHAPQNAKLAFLDGTMTAISPLWLRPDISLGSYFSGFDPQDEYVISIVYPRPPAVFPYLYLDRFLTPLHEIKVRGVTVARIWRNSRQYFRPQYLSFKEIPPSPLITGQDKYFGTYWQINLTGTQKITRLILTPNSQNCASKDGLFLLSDYFVPLRHNLDNGDITFDFPAETTDKIRFYPLFASSCLANPTVSKILSIDLQK